MNPTWEIDKTYKKLKLFREIIVVYEFEFSFNFGLINQQACKQSLLASVSGIPLLLYKILIEDNEK